VPDFNPGSPLSGETPDGRTYSVKLHTIFGSSSEVHVTIEHVTVRDGTVYRFPICETE
jgi:hypothetical protein